MTELAKVGDHLRLVIEGTILKVAYREVMVQVADGCTRWVDLHDDKYGTLTITRRPPKVGDIVETLDDLHRLPEGTILVSCQGHALQPPFPRARAEDLSHLRRYLPCTVIWLRPTQPMTKDGSNE